MPLLLLKELSILCLFSSFIVGSASKPTGYLNSNVKQDLRTRASLNTIKTTVTDTQIIDWIPLDSQGIIAQAPPPRAPRYSSRPITELEQPGADLGPPGTVPVSRANLDYLAKARSKALPGTQSLKRQTSDAGLHWYVSSNQSVTNIGGSGVFSLFAPYTQNTADSSLLQTAVIRQNVLLTGGRGPSIPVTQTVEAGWINFEDQVAAPHLFTFYTTNGYLQDADNQGGWNTEHTGWVQIDTQIHPGSVFTPLSVDGGTQQNLKIEYNLHQGNWWLAVEDRWIGYYPASLFSSVSSNDASTTLAGGSDTILFFGEVYNSEDGLTTTDMGSGEFASKGYGHAGYILNMTYTNAQNVSTPYNGVFTDSDVTRYTHEAHFLSGTDKGSYAFIGGPGAGGVVGGFCRHLVDFIELGQRAVTKFLRHQADANRVADVSLSINRWTESSLQTIAAIESSPISRSVNVIVAYLPGVPMTQTSIQNIYKYYTKELREELTRLIVNGQDVILYMEALDDKLVIVSKLLAHCQKTNENAMNDLDTYWAAIFRFHT